MSRGFVKESDQEEPVRIPPRAALPAGEVNYVTPSGLMALQEEEKALELEKAELNLENEDEQRRALTLINGKLELLRRRIAAAHPIDPAGQPKDEVRFGAKVTITNLANQASQTYQIVGVDEADVKAKKIAFVSPIARALTGLWTNEVAELKMGPRVNRFRVDRIEY
ncbi:transcription elongation factor GreA [Lewinellaceae bacterium SD302]|nr:transcription elongation factor GreA [Lewinellaceae bacterium SD302]